MKNKNQAEIWIGMLFAACLLSKAFAADAPADTAAVAPRQPQPAESVPVNVETFKGPLILRGVTGNMYPKTEVMDGREGWVVVNTMIDPQGKPFEAMVVDSSGNPAFDKAALRAVDQMAFQAARRGDTPIDSSLTFKLKFAIADMANGATPQYAAAYRRFTKAVQAGDKAKADAELARLKPENLYEEAFANYGKFVYHRQWGTPAEQLRDLEGAIAGEDKATYLPKDAFALAVYSKFRLEVMTSDYGQALETWKVLEPIATPEMRKDFGDVVEKIRAAQSGTQPVRQQLAIGSRHIWSSMLYRNRFSIAVKSGAISEIKLRCAQQYLFFKHQPGVVYSIGSRADRCRIEVLGDEGTTFELLQ
jgi:TonB family protein